MKNTTFTEFKASKFVVSPDLKYILLAYDVRKVYRYSYLASYLIYNIQTREVHELNPPEVSDCVLQFASWGNHDQQLVYIFENNIYYQPDVKSSSLRLTSSGRDGLIFNGITDWLYEEQILHSSAAHWWSPSGSSLAFLTINDTLVPNMQLPRFTGTLYPRGHQYPYPKAGQKNPEVTLFVINVNGSTHATQLLHPKSLQRSDLYISMVRWVTDECLAVRWLNRPQNSSILTLCYTHTGKCVPKHVMISDKWIDRQNEKPSFSKDGETFFVTLPLRSGGRGSFRHLTMMSEVSTVEPFHRECLSCSVFKPHCSFYEASVSPDRRAVLLNCRGKPHTHYITLDFDSDPGGQQVSECFRLDWTDELVSCEDVIVARLDGRGSGCQGQQILQDVYQRLGLVETEELRSAYGGFLSSILLLSHGSELRCGAAVSPVFDWQLYASHSYCVCVCVCVCVHQISSFLLNITRSENLRFLILHGTADANVHFQHTAELVKLLSVININYRLQIFPDEGHDVISSRYMLHSLVSFYRDCFIDNLPVPVETSDDD
uniref:Inactive dipeptidyl peptidase 10-like n=1 Tax=Sinocyclocheilus grahami TaxID=75366 RepID=A0A672P2M6_SINGR